MKTLDSMRKDIEHLAKIEYVNNDTALHTPIVFVDRYGNQYEYDGVSFSEGEIKISIYHLDKPIKSSVRVQRRYFNFENEKTIDMLPFSQDTLEKIRLERECMEKDIEGSIMNRSEIWHYLSNGFTIITYQADYVLEGEEFSYDE